MRSRSCAGIRYLPLRFSTWRQIVLAIPHTAYPTHNGGLVAFGPDGYLYIGTGDGCNTLNGDPFRNGQDSTTLLGKILRLDVNGAAPYAIPPTNPFVGRPPAAPEVWAYGLRNPWRFSFDRTTGDVYIADVGQYGWDEVDFAPAGDRGGRNYGWSTTEGTHCYRPASGCVTNGLVLPVYEYPMTHQVAPARSSEDTSTAGVRPPSGTLPFCRLLRRLGAQPEDARGASQRTLLTIPRRSAYCPVSGRSGRMGAASYM